MKPSIDRDGILSCPTCNEDYIHHGKIEVFDRAEDSIKGRHTVCNRSMVKIDEDMEGNPSRRRHGMIIHCQCEQCKGKFKLSVAQHKGQTFITVD